MAVPVSALTPASLVEELPGGALDELQAARNTQSDAMDEIRMALLYTHDSAFWIPSGGVEFKGL
jgi:hypothetical protein